MVVILFIGAAAAARQRIHIRVEALFSFVRGKLARDTINLGIDLIGFMCCCFWLYLTYNYMMYSWTLPTYAPAGGYHMGFVKSAPFVGGVLMAGHWLAVVVNDAIALARTSR